MSGFLVNSWAQASFFWGPQLEPNLSNRRLIAFSNISQEQIDQLEEREIGKPSLSAGVFAGWRKDKIGIRFGANYMETGYRTVKELIPPTEPDAANASERRLIFQNQNIEIPVEIQFLQELDRKNKFFFAMGSGVYFNLNNRTKTILYSGEKTDSRVEQADNSLFQSFNYSFRAGVGWETQLSENVSLVIEPTFKIWMQGILKDNELNRNLYSMGLRVAVQFLTEYEYIYD
ncbi:MAG: hypothetical protein DHS20C18_03250 [Saprospiraceae bacterium]|nr:MAG: hypothetical protein DHS20C18_03250 [Saprospiraceae bacterium]